MQVLLRINEVLNRTGLSRSEVYRRMALGQFPRRVKLGARSVGWVQSEIQEFIEQRIRESRGMGAPAEQPRAA